MFVFNERCAVDDVDDGLETKDEEKDIDLLLLLLYTHKVVKNNLN